MKNFIRIARVVVVGPKNGSKSLSQSFPLKIDWEVPFRRKWKKDERAAAVREKFKLWEFGGSCVIRRKTRRKTKNKATGVLLRKITDSPLLLLLRKIKTERTRVVRGWTEIDEVLERKTWRLLNLTIFFVNFLKFWAPNEFLNNCKFAKKIILNFTIKLTLQLENANFV